MKSWKRNIVEGVVCVIIVILAVLSFWPDKSAKEHYTLDKGQIVYDGYVYKNKFNGEGKLTIGKDKYAGAFKDGIFDGKGTFTSEKGWTYVGDFKKGVPEGNGVLTTEDGTIFKGVFKDGEFQK